MEENKELVYRFCLSDREMDLWNANLPQNISPCIVCAARMMVCLFIVGNSETNK